MRLLSGRRAQEPTRTHVAGGQRVGHARGGVDVRGERGDQRHENDDVHERADGRNARHLKDGGKGVAAHCLAVPRQQSGQEDDGADVEHENAGDDRADRAHHGRARVLGLGRGNRHDLQATEGRDDGQERHGDA